MTSVDPIDLLLVEDNPRDIELTLIAFEDHKLANRIHVVRDGAEALDFLLAEGDYSGRATMARPRLVLLDLKLPKVDGIEVLRTMRLDPRTRTVPVVVLTSSQEERDIIEAYRLGVNSYIVKPLDFEKFGEAVSTLGMYWLVLNQPPAQTAR